MCHGFAAACNPTGEQLTQSTCFAGKNVPLLPLLPLPFFFLSCVFLASLSARRGYGTAQTPGKELPNVPEARARARLLQETIHATLQIVHHRYYREDEGLPIPALTMKSVFAELARSTDVELHWLVVDGQAMNVEHNPRNDFEKKAVKALSSGENEFELVQQGTYRYVGAITLSNECLKCHLPRRTSTEDRAAGLVISMPVREE